MKYSKRKKIDIFYQGIITLIALIGLFLLIAIFGYVFKQGSGLLSWDLLTSDYYATTYDTYYIGDLGDTIYERPSNLDDSVYFSSKWGIGLTSALDNEGKPIILVAYIDSESPLNSLPDKNNEGEFVRITENQALGKVIFSNYTIILSSEGPENAANLFNQANGIIDMITTTSGKGIRGSILTTLYLIIMTLVIALPVGVFSAIYLHEFASKKSKIAEGLRRLVEMLTGVPSIIFGLMGAAVFIPFTSTITAADGGNLISGALTLAVIVLPVIITSTEEALKVIPDDFRQASLALGATKTQTTFKVVLKSAIPGILSAVLLSVGRIIGESAALIYAVGTAIKDKVILTERSTSLAVHIWSIMAGETPNFELASAISIIILMVVLILNLLVKVVAKKLSYQGGKKT